MIINKLRHLDGFFPILALDHGFSNPAAAIPVSNVSGVIQNCQHYYSAVVATYGFSRFFMLNKEENLKLIVQCFGMQFNGFPKAQICQVDQALEIGAAGVSVQVKFDLNKNELVSQNMAISKFVYEAHSKAVPVLFMIDCDGEGNIDNLLRDIRFAQELGADIIKVNIDIAQIKDKFMLGEVGAVLKFSPPVVIAGGVPDNNIVEKNKIAKECGFSGYCIGRNIYCNDNSGVVSRKIFESWLNH